MNSIRESLHEYTCKNCEITFWSKNITPDQQRQPKKKEKGDGFTFNNASRILLFIPI